MIQLRYFETLIQKYIRFMELLLVAFPTFGWQPTSKLPVLLVISTKL